MNLSFFRPLFLWGGLFAAVPIIIHLMRRKHTIKFDFTSIKFFKKTAVKASRMRRLKNILLLISRILIIIVIVLIFAHPYNKNNVFLCLGSSNTAVYCWIDPTISMSYKTEDISLWEYAYGLAGMIDSSLSPGAEFLAYDNRINDFKKLSLTDDISENTSPLQYEESDFLKMIQSFDKHRKKNSRIPVLVVFSDFQKKDKKIFDKYLEEAKINFPVILVSMGEKNPWNYSVSKAHISSENNIVCKSKIKSAGRKLESGKIVVLIGSMRKGHKSINLDKDDSASVEINVGGFNSENVGKVELLADDPFTVDNTGYFVRFTEREKQVLIVSEGKESFPIGVAIKSMPELFISKLIVKHPYDISYTDLDSSDIIILSSIKEPSGGISLLWKRGILSNKIILFSPCTEREVLDDLIFGYLKQNSKIDLTKSKKPLYPILPDTISAVWQGFPRFSDRDVAVYSYRSFIPGDVLLRLNNSMPLVTKIMDINRNLWIVFATPIGITEANNLCETGFYLPLLDRVLRQGMRIVEKRRPVWFAGILYKNPYYGSRKYARIFDSNNKHVALWDKQLQVMLSTPGLYKVVPDKESPYWIAVNTDPAEGTFVYDVPGVKEANKRYVKILNNNSLRNFITRHKSTGFDYLWLVLVFLLFLEVLFWKKQYAA